MPNYPANVPRLSLDRRAYRCRNFGRILLRRHLLAPSKSAATVETYSGRTNAAPDAPAVKPRSTPDAETIEVVAPPGAAGA